MKTIIRLFKLKLRSKELLLGQKFLAVIMIPLFVFQMTSLNLILIDYAKADEGAIAEEKAVKEDKVEKTQSEDKEEVKEEKAENKSEIQETEEKKTDSKIEVKDEKSDSKETPVASAKEEDEKKSSDLVQEENKLVPEDNTKGTSEEEAKNNPDVKDEDSSPDNSNNEVIGSDPVANPDSQPIIDQPAVGEITVPAVTEPSIQPKTPDNISDPATSNQEEMDVSHEIWDKKGDKAITNDPVEMNKTYVAPQNSQVTVIFTKLPKNPGHLSIEEINLTKEQQIKFNAVSDKAYDISSDMENGDFEYNLTLPKKDEKQAGVVYIEKSADELDTLKAEEVKSVEEKKISDKGDKLKIDGIDHFTIYIATYESDFSTSKSIYAQGETVYIKATGLNPDRYYKFAIDPAGKHNSYFISDCFKDDHSHSLTYLLANDAPIGIWEAEIFDYNNLSSCSNSGDVNSNGEPVKRGEFTVVAGAPVDTLPPITVANPAGGRYNANQNVSLSCSDGSGSGCDKIYYTLNGITPDESSNVYSGSITISSNTVLKFFAKDKSGNKEEIKTENYLIDKNAPAITLLGDSLVEISSDSTYIDAGATAVDLEDGDLTGKIIVTGSVNTHILGTYYIYYNVTDSAGNKAEEVTRTIKVKKQVTVTTLFPPISSVNYYSPFSIGVTVSGLAPSGTVSIKEGNNLLGTATIINGLGTVNFPFGSLSVGPHSLIGYYSGDSSNDGSISSPVILPIIDDKSPVFEDYSDIIVEATSSSGAKVNYDLPKAEDEINGSVKVWCSPDSGSVFSLGETTVKCEAKDASDNEAHLNFEIKVQDTTAPSNPGTPVANVISPTNQQTVSWNWASSSDIAGSIKYYWWNLWQGGIKILGGHTDETQLSQDLSSFGDGQFSLDVQAEDQSGNLSHWISSLATVIDTQSPEKPSANPGAGSYNADQLVALQSSDSGSGVKAIYYTTNGTDPDSNATPYTKAINIEKDTLLKAIAYDEAGNASQILEAQYYILPIISDESVKEITGKSAVIAWLTNELTTSRIVYDTVSHTDLGVAPNYGYAYSTVENGEKVINHAIRIKGLKDNTTYYFRVISHGSPEAVGGEFAFKTHKKHYDNGGNGNGGGTNNNLNNSVGTVRGVVSNNEAPGSQSNIQSSGANENGEPEVLGAETPEIKSFFNFKDWIWIALAILLGLFFWLIKRRKDKKKLAHNISDNQ